ncbi:DNA-binding protein [Thermus thermamylovorans]|uniref:DNA-binding protein n=1 Tax=Thermus thermamylovorans TaxID=2509362 RepID=A0A4V2IV05_9DEIN|nr:DNA-binding protein [Thermus thermamylovorans]
MQNVNAFAHLLTVEEVRELVGKQRLGRPTAYRLARRFGIRLGRRLLIPAWVVEALLEGRLDLEKEGVPSPRA